MAVLPPSNLNEASMPWARSVGEFIEQFEAGSISTRVALDLAAQQAQVALQQGVGQQKEIKAVQEVVAPVILPRTPTKPLLTSAASQVTIMWDGGFVEEEDVPGFKNIVVQVTSSNPEGAAPGSTFWLNVGQPLTQAAQTASYTGLPGEELWFRLIAYNNSGVAGEPSEFSKITVAYIKAPDIDSVVTDAITDAQDLAQEARNAANAAQTTANSKNKIWRQATQPPTTGNTVGDTWFNTSQGNQISRWDGSAWTLVPFGTAALSDNIITSAKLVDKAVSGAKLADKAVGSAQLTDAVNTSISTAQSTATNAQTAATNAATAASNAQTAANNAAQTAAAILVSAENKILDPSMSQDQWVDAGGWVVDKTTGRTDSASIKSAGSATTSQINALSQPRSNSPVTIPVEPGQVWELGGWWRVDDDYNGTSANSKLRLANQNSGLLGTSTSVPTNPAASVRNVWIYVSDRYTIPASGVTGLRLTVVADNTAGNVWWDDLVLRNVTAAVKAERDAATAKDAADLAKTVADGAQTAATAAQGAADAAASAASAAQTTANGKNRVIRSTAAATGTSDAIGPFVKGDQWWRYSGSTAVAMWVYDGGWQQQLMGSGAIATGAVTANELATAVNNNITKALTDSSTAITAAGTAQTTANGKNKVYRSTAAASGTAYVDGDVWYQYSGGQIVGVWIFAGTWQQQTFTDSVLTNISAATITTGILSADRLGANSITTNKLVVGDFTNLIEDEDFDAAIGVTWRRRSGATTASNYIVTTGLPGKAWKLDGVGTEVSVEQVNVFPVDPSARYRFNARAQVQLAGTGAVAGLVRIYWYKQDGTASATQFSQVTMNGSWSDYSVVVTAPADAFQGRVVLIHGSNNTSGSWWIGRLSLRRMATAELVVDGLITANSAIISTGAIGTAQIAEAAITNAKIADAQITAAKILSVDAGSITTGFLGADRIAGQSITGTHIAGGTITAANMATGTITAASGILANAAVGNAQIANGAITDAKIQNGTITNASIADATIQDAKIGNINAGKLTAGTIAADRFASNSISVSKLLVSNLTNLLEDPGFENPNILAGWSNLSSRTSRDTQSARTGSGALKLENQSTAYDAIRQRVPIRVEPGQKYLYSAWFRGNKTTIDQGLELSVYHSNNDQQTGTAVAVARSPIGGTSYTQFSGVFTVPAGSYFVTPRVVLRTGSTDTSLVYVLDDLAFQKMEDGSLIVDGAISGTMIAGNAIDGKVITGATVRTAATGQRLQLDTNGLAAYKADGTIGAYISSAAGQLRVTGDLGVSANGTDYQSTISATGLNFFRNTQGVGNVYVGLGPGNVNQLTMGVGSALFQITESASSAAHRFVAQGDLIGNNVGVTTNGKITSGIDGDRTEIQTNVIKSVGASGSNIPLILNQGGGVNTKVIADGSGLDVTNTLTVGGAATMADITSSGIVRGQVRPVMQTVLNTNATNISEPGVYYIADFTEVNGIPDPLQAYRGPAVIEVSGTRNGTIILDAFPVSTDATHASKSWRKVYNIASASGTTWTFTGDINTDWINLSLNSNWNLYAGQERIAYKRVGQVVFFTGRVSGTSAASPTIGVLPVGFRPGAAPYAPVYPVHSDDGILIGLVGQDGNVVVASRQNLDRRGVSFASVSYAV